MRGLAFGHSELLEQPVGTSTNVSMMRDNPLETKMTVISITTTQSNGTYVSFIFAV